MSNLAKKSKEEVKEVPASAFFQDDEERIRAIFNDDYQNRFIKCFVESDGYAEQIIDIMVPDFFDNYQRILVDKLIKHYNVNSCAAEYATLKRDVLYISINFERSRPTTTALFQK